MNANHILDDQYEYIIVGTGPGGGTLARELAGAGKKILVLEKGKRHEKLGFPWGLQVLDKFGYNRSKEGVYVGRGVTLGGSSVVFNANVYDPPQKLMEEMGLDFSTEAKEVKEEIGVDVLPERFFAHATGGNRVREAADKMGFRFVPQKKFINPELCRVGCDWCMLGCKYGAKWTSRRFVDEAVEKGAKLLTSTPVHSVWVEDDKTLGVVLKNGKKVQADRVIVASGGIGTAEILQNTGLTESGLNFFMDPMDLVLGYADDPSGGAWREATFSHAIEDFKTSEGFIIGNVAGAYVALTPLMRMNVMKDNFIKQAFYKRGIGLFVKLADTPHGRVLPGGKMEKPFLEIDNQRMKKGVDVSTAILIKAGIRPKNITVARSIGGHPGGTAAMGKIVDKNFQTRFAGLYACDASVLPQSPGVPPGLIVLSMAKLLSKMLLNEVRAEDRVPETRAA